MKKTILFTIIFFCVNISIQGQNTTFDNVSLGISYPTYGAKIKVNFPGYSGGWGRAYSITNETGEESFFTFGSSGFSTNGIATVTHNFIGKDLDTKYMTFLPNGNIGIGTTTPSEKIEIFDSNTMPSIISLKSARNDYGNVDVGRISAKQESVEVSRIGMPRANSTYSGYLTFWTKNNNEENLTEKVRISENGNVGIGTTNPTSKLTVAGNIASREVKVTVDAGADFVFEDDYHLPSLESVAQFIKEHKHLPEIASAKEMQKEGINLSEMNIKLLQKMEEMTLYIIEIKKENDLMKKDLLKLKQKK